MKIMKFALFLVLASGLTACSAIDPIPRDHLVANLAPILKVEKRFERVKYYTQMLISVSGISEERLEKLKPHYDIYYVYYLASNVQLARGNMESCLAHLQMAEREMDMMESILKDGLAKEWQSDSSRKREFSGSNLDL